MKFFMLVWATFFLFQSCVLLASDISDYTEGKAQLKQNNYDKAYEAFSKIPTDSPLNSYATYYQGLCAIKSKNYTAAQQISLIPKQEERSNTPFMTLRQQLHEVTSYFSGKKQSDSTLKQLAYYFKQEGDYDEALKCFENISPTSPQFQDIPIAIARTYAAKGNKDEAKKRYKELPVTPESLYYSSFMENEEDRMKTFEKIVKAYPQHALSKECAYSLYTPAKCKKNFDKALDYLHYLQQYSYYQNSSHFEEGLIHYMRQDYPAALKGFRKSQNDIYADASLYWQAKTHDKLGQQNVATELREKLISLFPFSYYSYRTFLLTRKEPLIQSSAELPTLAAPNDLHPRLKALIDAQAYDDAIYELTVFQRYRATKDPWNYLAALMAEKKEYYYLYRVSAHLHNNYLAYPLAYWDSIKTELTNMPLDPYLVLAIIREESNFNASAVSYSGAKGLMQLMPATAKLVAKNLKLTDYNLKYPTDNIRLGIRHFKYYVQQLGVLKGVAVYNCGEGNLKKFNAFDDEDLYVENIPIAQTRHYVKKVLGSYWAYKLLYDKENIATIS